MKPNETGAYRPRNCDAVCPTPNQDCEHPSCPRDPEVQRIERERFEPPHQDSMCDAHDPPHLECEVAAGYRSSHCPHDVRHANTGRCTRCGQNGGTS